MEPLFKHTKKRLRYHCLLEKGCYSICIACMGSFKDPSAKNHQAQPLSAAKYGILPRSDYTRRDFGLAGTLQTSSTNYLFTRILAKRSTASLKHRKLGAPKPFLDPANELERLQTHRKCPPRVAGEIKKAITHEQAQTAQTFNFAEILFSWNPFYLVYH